RVVDSAALERLRHEFRIAERVHHPGCVHLHELSHEGGWCFFTMELVRGVDFLTAVREPRLDEPRLRRLLLLLAQALQALHDAGLVHCDVKPANILVTEAGRLVLVDLGLATEPAGAAPTGAAAGTAAYMAP